MYETCYDSLSDEEFIEKFKKEWNIKKSNMWLSDIRMTRIPDTIADQVGFTDIHSCLDNVRKNYCNLCSELGLAPGRDSLIHMNRSFVCDNFDAIKEYTLRQVFLLTLYHSVLCGYIDEFTRFREGIYLTVMRTSNKVRIGFTTYNFLFLEDYFTLSKINMNKLFECLNRINSVLRKTVEHNESLISTERVKQVINSGKDVDIYLSMYKRIDAKNELVMFVKNGLYDFCL